jgi:uncharacterized cupredoxin-like copper-binding protein
MQGTHCPSNSTEERSVRIRLPGFSVVLATVAAFSSAPVRADATVNVVLKDKGGMMDMSQNMGLGMGMHGNMNKATTSIGIDKTTVPAGNITFKVRNASKETIHEMLVAPARDGTLPYVADENRVDEEASGDLGEVSELDPSASGSLTLALKPGRYVLFCNVPGHFMSGMWTVLNVK